MQLSELLYLLRFGIIGLVAAAIHYWMVVALVELGDMAPLLANLGGFASACWYSYFGHRHWTFVARRTTNATHLFFRFLAIAMLKQLTAVRRFAANSARMAWSMPSFWA